MARPIAYPTVLPMIAATVSSTPSTYTLRPNCGWAESSPAVTISESPGRKNPTSSPVSAKMMAVRPTYPPDANELADVGQLMEKVEKRLHSARRSGGRRQRRKLDRRTPDGSTGVFDEMMHLAEQALTLPPPPTSRWHRAGISPRTERVLDVIGGAVVALLAIGWTWSIADAATRSPGRAARAAARGRWSRRRSRAATRRTPPISPTRRSTRSPASCAARAESCACRSAPPARRSTRARFPRAPSSARSRRSPSRARPRRAPASGSSPSPWAARSSRSPTST